MAGFRNAFGIRRKKTDGANEAEVVIGSKSTKLGGNHGLPPRVPNKPGAALNRKKLQLKFPSKIAKKLRRTSSSSRRTLRSHGTDSVGSGSSLSRSDFEISSIDTNSVMDHHDLSERNFQELDDEVVEESVQEVTADKSGDETREDTAFQHFETRDDDSRDVDLLMETPKKETVSTIFLKEQVAKMDEPLVRAPLALLVAECESDTETANLLETSSEESGQDSMPEKEEPVESSASSLSYWPVFLVTAIVTVGVAIRMSSPKAKAI